MIYHKGATQLDQCAHRLMEFNLSPDWHGSTIVGDYIAYYHEEKLYTVRHLKKGVSCLVYARSPYDAIEKVRIMEEPRWIPVTERLPEKDTRVIVCASLPEGVHSDFIYEDGHWFVSTGVTHWMPFPEPPKDLPFPDDQAEEEEACTKM